MDGPRADAILPATPSPTGTYHHRCGPPPKAQALGSAPTSIIVNTARPFNFACFAPVSLSLNHLQGCSEGSARQAEQAGRTMDFTFKREGTPLTFRPASGMNFAQAHAWTDVLSTSTTATRKHKHAAVKRRMKRKETRLGTFCAADATTGFPISSSLDTRSGSHWHHQNRAGHDILSDK